MQLSNGFTPGLKMRETKASSRARRKNSRNRRGLYAAAAFASVATASLGMGGLANADTATGPDGSELLTQFGTAVGSNLDPAARTQLESALSGVASLTAGTPLADPVGAFTGGVQSRAPQAVTADQGDASAPAAPRSPLRAASLENDGAPPAAAPAVRPPPSRRSPVWSARSPPPDWI